MTNKAMYMTGIRKMEMREIDVPRPKDDQVLIKLEYVGICGSDVHYLEHGKIGDFIVEGDFILGHECSGVVVEVGKLVRKLKVGDKVALEPGVPCGQCEFCKSGKYNLCLTVAFFSDSSVSRLFDELHCLPGKYGFQTAGERFDERRSACRAFLAVGLQLLRREVSGWATG